MNRAPCSVGYTIILMVTILAFVCTAVSRCTTSTIRSYLSLACTISLIQIIGKQRHPAVKSVKCLGLLCFFLVEEMFAKLLFFLC